jgi:hypothetical protein
MTIFSSYDVDKSAVLARRFAVLATTYVDDPIAATSDAAKVPLENLFRILEMFRYDAYADESRRGVLAVGGPSRQIPGQTARSGWYTDIARALDAAFKTTFADATKDAAVAELEDDLRTLASTGTLPAERAIRTKEFFSTFGASLP